MTNARTDLQYGLGHASVERRSNLLAAMSDNQVNFVHAQREPTKKCRYSLKLITLGPPAVSPLALKRNGSMGMSSALKVNGT